ncbi:sodium/hydrogen exchanger 2-like isoform X2 [Halichondria panicea]|uniref:sodium/hydrogen exchanger 2-like isoform X2 n=1 Tax=Halichondria panicea TaxID=6063 RepID=UPI00312BBE54
MVSYSTVEYNFEDMLVWNSILLASLVAVCSTAEPSHGDTSNTNATMLCSLPSTRRTIEPSLDITCGSNEERSFDSSVHVARVDLERVQVLLIVTLFIMIVVIAKLVWHHRWMHPVASNIPESCMLIIVGAHIGGILIGSFYLDPCNRDQDPPLRFTPEIFFLYLLPPIVLESGYFLDIRAFFENFTTIIVFAVIGTLWNTVAIGMTLFGLYEANLLLTEPSLQNSIFNIPVALLFGTICSAVDPVAVLAVFDDIHVNKLLHILVFGESLLNDAVTIVLFNVLRAFSNRPFDTSLSDDQRIIPFTDVVIGVVQFFVVVLASFVIGVLMGMIAAFITRFSEHVHVLEPIIVFTMGYLSYILADMFEFSGIVSLIFCAITMKHYVEANVSRKSSTTIKYSMKVVSNVSEMIIFLFLGLSLYESDQQNWDWGLSLFSLLFALLYRPIGVIALTLIVNIFRFKKIGFKSVFVMSYSGLRGAVAFSLALARLHGEPSLEHPTTCMIQSEAQLRKTMLTATTFLVLFTVFVQGITIKPLVKLIKVKKDREQKPTMNEVIHGTTIDHVMSGLEDIIGHLGQNRLREKLQEIDSKYLRKFFERYPESRDEQILHIWRRLQYQESQRAVEQCLEFKYHRDAEGKFGSHISLHSANAMQVCSQVTY